MFLFCSCVTKYTISYLDLGFVVSVACVIQYNLHINMWEKIILQFVLIFSSQIIDGTTSKFHGYSSACYNE